MSGLNDEQLQQRLEAIGDERIIQYRDPVSLFIILYLVHTMTEHTMKTFPEEVVNFNPQYFAPANASQWMNIDRFMHWMTNEYQGLPQSSRSAMPMFSSSPVPPLPKSARFTSTRRLQTPSSPISVSSVGISAATSVTTKHKRPGDVKRESSPVNLSVDEAIDLTADSDNERVMKKLKGGMKSVGSIPRKSARAPKPIGNEKGKADREQIELTRQPKCNKVVELTEIPTCWTVLHPDYMTAYLLNLTADSREWRDSKGELMLMTTIIKSQVCSLDSLHHCVFRHCFLIFCLVGSGCMGRRYLQLQKACNEGQAPR
jgi:hypothetical protein